VAPAKPIAMGSPARANTRNLKVAAIIEKANAIRQVGCPQLTPLLSARN